MSFVPQHDGGRPVRRASHYNGGPAMSYSSGAYARTRGFRFKRLLRWCFEYVVTARSLEEALTVEGMSTMYCPHYLREELTAFRRLARDARRAMCERFAAAVEGAR